MASEIKKELFNQTLTTSTVGNISDLELGSQDYVLEMRATNVNAATTLDVKIEHSSDRTNWYDLASFTQLVGVDGSELITNVDKSLNYVRGNATLVGATQSADVVLNVLYRK